MTCIKTILVSVLLLTTICSGASIDLNKWQYTAEVTVEAAPGEYCALVLTPEIYNIARTDLADIRLIGRDGNQIPYVLVRDEDRTETVKYGRQRKRIGDAGFRRADSQKLNRGRDRRR